MVGMIVFIFRQFILCEKKPPPLPEEQNATQNKKNYDKFASWYAKRWAETTEYDPDPKTRTIKIWESGKDRLIILEYPDIFQILSVMNFMLSIGLSMFDVFFEDKVTGFDSGVHVDLLAHFKKVENVKYTNCINIF